MDKTRFYRRDLPVCYFINVYYVQLNYLNSLPKLMHQLTNVATHHSEASGGRV